MKKTGFGFCCKLIAVLAIIVMTIGLCACGGGASANAFADGTSINGVDVSKMTAEEAEAAINAAIEEYTFTFDLEDFHYFGTSTEMELALHPDADFQAMIDEGLSGEIVDNELLTCTMYHLKNQLGDYVEQQDLEEAHEAHLVFDEASDSFIAEEGDPGYMLNPEEVAQDLGMQYVAVLEPEVEMTLEDFYMVEPTLTPDSPEVLEAINRANAYKNLTINLSFTPEDRDTTHESIGWAQIKGCLEVDYDGLTLTVNDTALSNVISGLASRHSVSYGGSSQFRTHSGAMINVGASTSGQSVDSNGLYQIVYDAIRNNRGGSFEAPYNAPVRQEQSIVDFGGHYVELDLGRQMMYLYNNGQLVCSAPCVSGNVSRHWNTPSGIYHIYSKQTSRYLTGPGYRSFVNYWMPFNGGIGLHDGTWRSVFGGTEYLYNGSHGCVNLPLGAAATVFNTVHVGTTVIVYGGAGSVNMLPQEIGLPNSTMNLTCRQSAAIGATAATTFLYSSSDEAVATVDANGNVTAVGPGTATIHIIAEQSGEYLPAEANVTVTVSHSMGAATVTAEPTCTAAGRRTSACVCGNTVDEEIPALGHSWGTATVTTAPDCVNAGVGTQSCTRTGCTATQQTAIPATGHTSVLIQDEYPSETHHYECSVCGTSLSDPEPCDFMIVNEDESHSCSVCGRTMALIG